MNASDKAVKVLRDTDVGPVHEKIEDEVIKMVRACCQHVGLSYRKEVRLMATLVELFDDKIAVIICDSFLEQLEREMRDAFDEPEM